MMIARQGGGTQNGFEMVVKYFLFSSHTLSFFHGLPNNLASHKVGQLFTFLSIISMYAAALQIWLVL